MHLPYWVKPVKKVLAYYSRNLLGEDKEKIDLGSGTANGKNLAEKGVVWVIGGYKLVFLMDLVASCLFKRTEREFGSTKYRGIYRDDESVVKGQ
eukprot:14208927-Ditylum_brightwellii.AAC.1